MPNPIDRLASLFAKFPGIGPRQARRFVYAVLRQSPSYADELAMAIREVRQNVKLCRESYQYFYATNANEEVSPIVRDESRDFTLLMVVETDADLLNIEKSKAYSGQYFVLGGTLPILEKEPEKKIRIRELIEIVRKRHKEKNLREIILATSVSAEGEHTAEYVKNTLAPVTSELGINISVLGRGLSTGISLEYPDPDTLKNALKNRS